MTQKKLLCNCTAYVYFNYNKKSIEASEIKSIQHKIEN